MAAWNVKLATGLKTGLTVYQLQELIRGGKIGANDEAIEGDERQWRRVSEIPVLARFLPEDPSVPRGELPKTVQVHGLTLEVGPDGKPKPPPPELVAKLLAAELGGPAQRTHDLAARTNRRLIVGVTVVLFGLALVLLRQIVHARAMR